MEIVELAKKLISIPSYVDAKVSEKEFGNFIYDFLKKLPFLTKIKKQKVEGDRCNIVASDGFKPEILFACHLDTVEPRGWSINPFKGLINRRKNKLYGLGSNDMKGGIAALLTALQDFQKTKGLMLLFYCDEEYNFKGMKKFLEEYKISPKLIVAPEPSDLEIWNGCRGLLKVSFRVMGLTGSSSRPEKGKNAILGLVAGVNYLPERLKKYHSKYLGPSSCNLSSLLGGLSRGRDKAGFPIISRRGDSIPDIAEATLDLRPATSVLRAKQVFQILNKFLTREGFKLEDFFVQHDLGVFYTKPSQLKLVEEIIKKTLGEAKYMDLPKKGSYTDIQLINEKLDVPCICFGPKGENRHKANEWVDIRSLEKTKEVYKNLIKKYCQS